MAAKVDKKIVAILGGGVLALVIAVVLLLTVVMKSVDDHMSEGAKHLAAKDPEKAAISFSKAASKDQNNTKALEAWADAISQITPTNQQAYQDRFRDYLGARRRLAEVLRSDVAAHSFMLDLSFQDARLNGSNGQIWTELERQATTAMDRFAPDDKNAGAIAKYRGVATMGRVSSRLEVSQADRDRAKADFERALAVNANDAMAAAGLGDWYRVAAESARLAGNVEVRDLALNDGIRVTSEFLARNPDAASVRMALSNLEISKGFIEAQATGMSNQQASGLIRPKLVAVLDALDREDPKVTDVWSAVQACEAALGIRVDNGADRAIAIIDRLVAAHPTNGYLALARARIMNLAGKHREAAAALKELSERPNLPVSPDGVRLFLFRDMAAIERVNALLAGWDKTSADKDPTLKSELLKEVQAAAKEVQGRQSIGEPTKLLVSGKLAVAQGDLADGRKLLSQYLALSNNDDVEAMAILADVLLRQRLLGEAKQMLTRIVEMRRANANTFVQIARIELELRNYPRARDNIESALSMEPENPVIVEMAKRIKDLVDGPQSGDPLVRLLNEAEVIANSTPPDFAGALVKLREAVKICKEANQFERISAIMFRMGFREDALATADAGLVKFKDDKNLLEMKRRLSVADPVAEQIRIIDEGTGTALDKAKQKYLMFVQVGDFAKASDELLKAEAIDANDALVVAGRFEQALRDGDFERGAALAAKGEAQDLDKVAGRLYKARLAMVQGKFKEATPLLEQATEIDSLNPITWRLLGQAYMSQGQSGKGITALERSRQIRPQESQTIVALLSAFRMVGRTTEALALARDSLRFGIADQTFVDQWLDLEFETGDREKAIDRRTRLFEQDKNRENVSNAISLAAILLRDRRVDSAERVLNELGDRPAAATQIGLLRAAIAGGRGDLAGAEAKFVAIESGLKPEEIDGSLHIEFARMVDDLGSAELGVKILERGRKFQKDEAMIVERSLGDLYFRMQQFDNARQCYVRAREAIKEDQNNLLTKRIAECALRARQFEDAEAALAKAGGAESKDQQVLLLLAEVKAARDDRAAASDILNKAVALDPQSAMGYMRRGEFNFQDPKLRRDVEGDFEQALRLDPRSTRGRLLVMNFRIREGEIDRAIRVLEDGLQLDPMNIAWRSAHIDLLTNVTRYTDAINSSMQMMQLSNDPQWAIQAGAIYARVGDMKGAASMFEQAWKGRKDLVSGKAYADALISLGGPENIAKAKAIVADPAFDMNTALALLTRARLSTMDGRKADAVADVKAAVGKTDVASIREGFILVDEVGRVFAGNTVDALDAFRQAAPAGGFPESMRVNIARLATSNAVTRNEAISELNQLVNSQDKTTAIAAASLLGTVLFNEKQTDQAIAAYQKGLAIDPNQPELLNNLAYVLSKGARRHAEALPLAEKAAELAPNNPNILDSKGAIQLELGNLAEAEKTLVRARSITNDPVARTMPTVHLIEVYIKQNRKVDADLLWSELQKMMRSDPRIEKTYPDDLARVRNLVQTGR